MSTKVANPEFRREMREQAAEEAERRKSELVTHQTTKQWLESVKEAGIVEISLFEGEPHERSFEFTQPGTGTISEAMQFATTSGDADLEDLPGMLRRVCEILGDNCQDPEMGTQEFSELPPGAVEEAFTELVDQTMSNVDQEDLDHDTQEALDQFREE